MNDRLITTRLIDGTPVKIYERSATIPNAAIGMIPTTTVYETIYIMPAPDWPKVRIRARRFFSRIFYHFGYHPGLMLDDPQFNAAFRVDAEDENFAIMFLNPDLQTFLLTKTNIDWSAGRGAIKLFYRGGLRKNRIDKSIQRLRNFRNLINEELFVKSAMPLRQ